MARTPHLMKAAVTVACASLLLAGCGHSAKRSAATTSTVTSTTSALVPTTTAGVTITAAPGTPHTTQLGDQDSGKSVAVHPGDTIVVTLSNCFSCGYRWNVTTASDVSVVAHRSTEDHQAQTAPGQVGGSGTRVFTFQAVGPGKTRVELGYFPPAKGAQAETTYVINFVVS